MKEVDLNKLWYKVKGKRVYLITDKDQYERIITGLMVCVSGSIKYELACGTQKSWHHEEEISKEKTYSHEQKE